MCESLVDANSNPVSFSSSKTPYVRALCLNADATKVVVGTSSSEVFEFDISSKVAFKKEQGRRLVMQVQYNIAQRTANLREHVAPLGF